MENLKIIDIQAVLGGEITQVRKMPKSPSGRAETGKNQRTPPPSERKTRRGCPSTWHSLARPFGSRIGSAAWQKEAHLGVVFVVVVDCGCGCCSSSASSFFFLFLLFLFLLLLFLNLFATSSQSRLKLSLAILRPHTLE